MEWSNENKFSSFNSYKGLTYYENYKRIMRWLKGENFDLPPPIECNLDPMAECNLDCYFCFDRDEKVTMADLSHRKIKDIQVGDDVLGYRDKKVVITKVLNVFDNGRRDWLYKITFDDGDSIICTKDHKIWKAERSKWTEARRLRTGHKVKKLLHYGNPSLKNLTIGKHYKQGYIAGLAAGDGSMRGFHRKRRDGGYCIPLNHQFRLAMKDIEPMERFASYCTDLGIVWSWGKCNAGSHKFADGHIEHIEYEAIYIHRENECQKVIKLMKNPTDRGERFMVGWLAGMFDAEGCISSGIRIHQNVGTETYNNMREVATSLGYKFTEERRGIRLYGGTYEVANFMLRHRPAIKRKVNGYILEKDAYTSRLVVKIERVRGQRRIFDLETASHNYFVKGVLVHNCITQRYLRTHREEVGEMRQLPKEYMYRLVDFLAVWGVRGLCISGGGEPSLHTEMPYIIPYAMYKGMDVAFVTNASLIDDKLAEALMCCRWVALSVDSADWKTYNQVKGRNLFDNVVANIGLLSDARARTNSSVDLCFKFLVLPENQHQIFDACLLAKELGVQDFHARPVDFERKDIKGHKQLDIDIDRVQEEFARCHEIETADFHVYTVIHKFDSKFHVQHDFTQCLATPLVLPILQDGNAYLCVDKKMESKFRLGSCYPDPENILKWWGSEEHRQLIKSVNIDECSRCTWSQYNRQISEVVEKDGMCLSFP